METTQGVIQAVSEKQTSTGKDTYSFKIDNFWYAGFGKAPYEKGEVVEVNYVLNGAFRNIKKVSLIGDKKVDVEDVEDPIMKVANGITPLDTLVAQKVGVMAKILDQSLPLLQETFKDERAQSAIINCIAIEIFKKER